MFSSEHRCNVEWGDCDPAGIVFYPRFFAMFDMATAHLFEAATGKTRTELIKHYEILGWPMFDTHAQFLAPVSFDDRVCIRSKIARLGTSSFDINHELYVSEKLCVTCEELRVWCEYSDEADSGIAALPLPDDIRDLLLQPEL